MASAASPIRRLLKVWSAHRSIVDHFESALLHTSRCERTLCTYYLKGLLEKCAICDTPLLYKIAAQETGTVHYTSRRVCSPFSRQHCVCQAGRLKTCAGWLSSAQPPREHSLTGALLIRRLLEPERHRPTWTLQQGGWGGVPEICRCSRYRGGGGALKMRWPVHTLLMLTVSVVAIFTYILYLLAYKYFFASKTSYKSVWCHFFCQGKSREKRLETLSNKKKGGDWTSLSVTFRSGQSDLLPTSGVWHQHWLYLYEL